MISNSWHDHDISSFAHEFVKNANFNHEICDLDLVFLTFLHVTTLISDYFSQVRI